MFSPPRMGEMRTAEKNYTPSTYPLPGGEGIQRLNRVLQSFAPNDFLALNALPTSSSAGACRPIARRCFAGNGP